MRSGGALVAVGVAALLIFGGVACSNPAWASDAGKKVQVKVKVHRTKRYECVLNSGPVPEQASKASDDDGDADDSPSRATPPPHSGNLVVEIPPVVIARAHGKRLVVTTNTGEPPNRQEAIYFVSKGKGGLAPKSIRDQVLSG